MLKYIEPNVDTWILCVEADSILKGYEVRLPGFSEQHKFWEKYRIMSTKKRKNIGWTLREFMVKIAVMVITIGIGLWCGWIDSYGAFYIAVLVQAVNNMYDSSAFLGGYTRFVTVFQIIVFLGALESVVLAVVHFTNGGSAVDSRNFVIGIAIALSIPILHFGIEVYSLVRHNRY